jgi:hypothetical protein
MFGRKLDQQGIGHTVLTGFIFTNVYPTQAAWRSDLMLQMPSLFALMNGRTN